MIATEVFIFFNAICLGFAVAFSYQIYDAIWMKTPLQLVPNDMAAKDDNLSSSLLVTIIIGVAIFFNVLIGIVTVGTHRLFKSAPVQDSLWLDTCERTGL